MRPHAHVGLSSGPAAREAGDANFQHHVIQHGLELLSRAESPVLEDFPSMCRVLTKTSCRLASLFLQQSDNGGWGARLLAEFNLLEPWYQLSLRRRKGRTLVGIAPRLRSI